MEAIQLLDMTVNSIYGEEKKVLKELDQKLAPYFFKKNDCEEFKIALAEVCINAIEHGNEEKAEKPVHVSVKLKGNLIESTVCDTGKGSRLQPVQDTDRGWGLKLIQNFVDSWTTYQTDSSESLFCVVISKQLQSSMMEV